MLHDFLSFLVHVIGADEKYGIKTQNKRWRLREKHFRDHKT